MAKDGDYEVGYGKPPKANQFRKGHSGNSKGRPKGATSLHTLILRAGSKQVTVLENGKPRTLTRLELAIEQLANQASAGQRHVVFPWLQLMRDAQETAAAMEDARDKGMERRDRELVEAFSRRNAGLLVHAEPQHHSSKDAEDPVEERPLNVIP